MFVRFLMSKEKSVNYYKLRVSYDGTQFEGWQQQPNGRAIADVLTDTFKKVFNTSCTLVGASRTDSGVHAYDQVVRVATSLTIDPIRLMHAWNNAVPSDIVIRSAQITDARFHPQYHVAYKEYWYHIFLKRPLPFFGRFGWFLPEYITHFDQDLFAKTLSLFEGAHDFTSFACIDEGRNPVRTVDRIRVEYVKRYQCVRVVVRGEGFLRYQIRRMVGAGLMVARSGAVVSYDDIVRLLSQPEKKSPAFFKVPGQGLCLRKIVYKEELV